MAEDYKCDICGKPATVHLKHIEKDQVREIHLCAACAQNCQNLSDCALEISETLKKGLAEVKSFVQQVTGKTDVDAADLGASLLKTLKCETCGTTPETFQKRGRLGCPDCYRYLHAFLSPVLDELQDAAEHHGHHPLPGAKKESPEAEIKRLELRLQKAVEQERYEDAARLRDEILSLKAQSKSAK